MLDKKNKQLVFRFLCVGGVGFIFNYTVLQFSTITFDLHKIQGEIIAAIVALQVTFLLHDNWTYEVHKNTESVLYRLPFKKRYGAYIFSNSFGSIMTVVFFGILSMVLIDFIALGFAAIAAMVWNFIINKFFIWRHVPLSEKE